MLDKLGTKQIGMLLLVVSIMMGLSVFFIANSAQASHEAACEAECGSVHEDHTCPMERPVYESIGYYFSISFAIIIGISGFYMMFSGVESLVLGGNNKLDSLMLYLKDDEKNVIEEIRKQNGIKQSTLKYRVDFSKSKLSHLVNDLVNRGLIRREEAGKTYKLFVDV